MNIDYLPACLLACLPARLPVQRATCHMYTTLAAFPTVESVVYFFANVVFVLGSIFFLPGVYEHDYRN
eukprot:4853539-Prymnesium_polylepis.1